MVLVAHLEKNVNMTGIFKAGHVLFYLLALHLTQLIQTFWNRILNRQSYGGNTWYSYKYLINDTGIDTEASYLYTASDDSLCKYHSTFKGASITD